MTNVRMTTLVMELVSVIFCFGLSKAEALLLDDGQIHNIDSTINEGVEVRDDDFFDRFTTVNVLDGAWMSLLQAYERSIVNVFGGSTVSSLGAYDSSQVDIFGGSISHLYAHDSSQVTFSGGSITYNLTTSESSQVTFSSGSLGLDLQACDSSQVDICGGSIGERLIAYDSSEITVSGGLIGGEILAGPYGGYGSFGNSVITFVGSDFAINGVLVGYGEFDTGGQDSVHGLLTGTLFSGVYLDNEFYIYGDSRIALVPEPATFLLLGLGAVILRRKR